VIAGAPAIAGTDVLNKWFGRVLNDLSGFPVPKDLLAPIVCAVDERRITFHSICGDKSIALDL